VVTHDKQPNVYGLLLFTRDLTSSLIEHTDGLAAIIARRQFQTQISRYQDHFPTHSKVNLLSPVNEKPDGFHSQDDSAFVFLIGIQHIYHKHSNTV
jgi:hypothetical protein